VLKGELIIPLGSELLAAMVMTENGCMMVGEIMEITWENGKIRLISLSKTLSHYQTLESWGVHAASFKMLYPTTRKRFHERDSDTIMQAGENIPSRMV
jgi:hypothetical protein